MATRQEIQIAQDLIRFVNIMNDLIDVASYMLQEIDAQTGKPLQVTDKETELLRDLTLEELKNNSVRACQNIGGYFIQIQGFLDKVDLSMVSSGLTALGVDVNTLKNEMLAINDARNYVKAALSSAVTKADLVIIGQYIDANIPKLTLVRRSWCIGV
jgi:hypothetical protein